MNDEHREPAADRPGLTVVAFEELHANARVSSLFRWAATLKEPRG